MIFTNAGKPVFSSTGDIYHLSPIIATLYAIISKYETFQTDYRLNPLEEQLVKEAHQRKEKSITNRISKTAKDIINDDLAELVRLD